MRQETPSEEQVLDVLSSRTDDSTSVAEDSTDQPALAVVEPVAVPIAPAARTSRLTRCRKHTDEVAVVKCDRCLQALCEECAGEEGGIMALGLCACGGCLLPTTLAERGIRRQSFDCTLDAAFRYPLERTDWKNTASGTLALGLLLLGRDVPLLGPVVLLFVVGYVSVLMRSVIEQSQRHSSRPLEYPLFELQSSSYWKSFAWVCAAYAGYVGPGALLWKGYGTPFPAALALTIAGALLLPLVLARLAHREGWWALHPVAIARIVRDHPNEVFVSAMLVLAAAFAALAGLVLARAFPVAGTLAGTTFGVYFLVVLARVLGKSGIGI